MKKAIILCAMAIFCCVGAMAQNPFKDLTKNESVVTFKLPTIVDFVTAYLSVSDDELRGSIAPEWENYLNNKPVTKGYKILVDKKNGYVRFDVDYDVLYPKDKMGDKLYVEFCYWNCSDGLHKLFAENIGQTRNERPLFTEYSGLYIYAFDNATQKLYMIDQDLLGLDENVHGEVTFALPRNGKDIEVFYHKPKKAAKKLEWKGKGFSLSK